jgi:hypothetical protein
LQHKLGSLGSSGRWSGVSGRLLIFKTLHDVRLKVLAEDEANTKAKTLLQKLESCHDLFRTVLRSIISGNLIWLKPAQERTLLYG